MHSQLVQEWGQFLSQFSWDWFLTLTFRDEVKLFRAHRLFEIFVQDLEKAAGQPIFWFRADEIGPHGGRFHIHALIGNVAHLRRMSWVDKWDALAGYARILPFSSKRGAAYYCAKYVTKQFGDWQLSDNIFAFKHPQRVLELKGSTKQKQQLTPPLEAKARPMRPKHGNGRQVLFPEMLRPMTKRESMLSQVYRSEVTRGKTRFREFFPRPGGRRT